ncbi:hypothetical protein [Klebsiella pneumoniae]|uniref:hypothetical protein n=1 Tax=Klebsiella pneumoniae TaxID=573 RepID=UPI000E2A96E7|nr:hypothetical protein [Klebsiella pneumoniae]SYF74482.1 Uncharacterised protein [Klebsiella pneumoniae]
MVTKLLRSIANILKWLRFPVGAIAILFVSYNFVSSHPREPHNDEGEISQKRSFTGVGMFGNQSETTRVKLAEPLVISGYSKEIRGRVTTVVTYKGSPVLLSRKMMNRDIKNNFDLVRMSDGRVFFCESQRNDNCWLVLTGDKQLPYH